MSNLGKLRAFFQTRRRLWIVILLLLIIIIGAVIVFMTMQTAKENSDKKSTKPPQPMTEVCTDAINKEADRYITASDQIGLGKVVDKVMALDGYDRDPNCLYIVLRYQLGMGNASASRATLKQLKKYVDATFLFSDEFTERMTIKSLQKNVDFLSENTGQELDSENLKSGSNEADRYNREHQP